MTPQEDALGRLPVFAGLPDDVLAAAARAWRLRCLKVDEPLWDQGAAVDELAFLLDGTLVATLDDVEVAQVQPGELVGEVAAFFAGQDRSLALKAGQDCTILVLPVTGLRTLRWQRSPVYLALLDHALHALAARIRVVDAAISRLAVGAHTPPEEPSPSRWWRNVPPEAPTDPRPDPIRTLRLLPALREADDQALLAVADAFVVEPLTRGRILCREGEPGTDAWLLASGKVDVYRHVRDDGAERLSTQRPPARVGLLSLVDGGPRTATCVVSRPGWALRIDTAAHASLTGNARMCWHECMLAALGTQMRNANEILAHPTGVRP